MSAFKEGIALLTREDRMKMAMELTRLVWDLKNSEFSGERSDMILDVFETCYRKMEGLGFAVTDEAPMISVIEEPVVPAD